MRDARWISWAWAVETQLGVQSELRELTRQERHHRGAPAPLPHRFGRVHATVSQLALKPIMQTDDDVFLLFQARRE